MRNISVLALVLFLSISANAAVQIGVDDYNVSVGGTTNVSILTDATLFEPFYGFLGIMEGEPGILSGDPIVQDPHILIYPPPDPIFELPPGFSSGVWFGYDGLEPVPGPGTLIDGIIFECTGIGNVNLWLYGTTDFVEMNLYDVQTIHQIPEPVTIAMLGLGAMLLKRRK